jgi:hypothetical protein
MMEQLLSMIQQSSQEVVEQNPEVPNDQNEAVSNVASESIVGSIQSLISNGGAADLMSMFSGNNAADASNPVMQTVTSDLSGNLQSRLGISSDKAGGLAASILPMIISKLFNKSGNGGGFDLSSLIGSLTGGQGGGGGFNLGNITSMLGGSGLDINKDGKTDFNDLTAALGGDKSEEGKKDSREGGLLDSLSGLLGK